MKIKIALLGIAASLTLTACETTTPTNANVRANSNTAVVTNTNTNSVVTTTNTNNAATTNTNSSASRNNSNISREEYDKDKTRYDEEIKRTGSSVGTGINDTWLWTKTRTSLLGTEDLRDSTINVDVANEVVTLKGTVATAAQKTRAEQVAKDITGVKSVKNELKVNAGDSVTNTNTGAANTNTNRK